MYNSITLKTLKLNHFQLSLIFIKTLSYKCNNNALPSRCQVARVMSRELGFVRCDY